MALKKTRLIFLYFFIFLVNLSAQKLGIKDIKNLRVTHQINQIYALEMIKEDGLLIGDTRLEGGDLDGLLVRFNLKGRVLKEVRLGRTDSYERIVQLEKTEKGYYLLMNSVQKGGIRRLLLYELDNELSILLSEVVDISNIITANAMTYDRKRNRLMIAATVSDKAKNSFPQLVTYDLATKKVMNRLDFSQVNRPEKGEEVSKMITIIDEDGKRVSRGRTIKEGLKYKPPRLIKECISIRFTDEDYKELILTGLESSSTITDFWVAKVVDNQIIWEDRYPTEVGGDEGHFTFKTERGYLSIGHEYSKVEETYYSYRTLFLDENGQEKGANRFDKNKKDWFKDVIRFGKRHFVMFGQAQETILPEKILGEEKTKTSNLWAVIVNDKGELVGDYELQTKMIDEAHTITLMDNGDMLILFERDGELMIGVLELLVP